jgi:flagellar motor switch protein FliM
VSVRDLSRIEVGTVLTLSAPVSGPGWLKLEGQPYFDALPVGQGSNKAMQLVRPLHVNEESNKPTGENKNANA